MTDASWEQASGERGAGAARHNRRNADCRAAAYLRELRALAATPVGAFDFAIPENVLTFHGPRTYPVNLQPGMSEMRTPTFTNEALAQDLSYLLGRHAAKKLAIWLGCAVRTAQKYLGGDIPASEFVRQADLIIAECRRRSEKDGFVLRRALAIRDRYQTEGEIDGGRPVGVAPAEGVATDHRNL